MRTARSRLTTLATLGVVALVMAACGDGGGNGGDEAQPPERLTLLTHPTIFESSLGGENGPIAEFEEATGIGVDIVTAPIGEHLERAVAEFRAGSGRFDVIALQNIDYNDEFVENLLPLDSYIAGADDNWDPDDFIESLVDFVRIGDEQFGIPVRFGTQMLYYNEALRAAAGVDVPETLDEFRDSALAATGDDVYGALQRGQPRELANDWLGFLYSAGGHLLDDDMTECLVDEEPGVLATDALRDVFQGGALPADFFAWGRDDYIAGMQQGRGVMGVYFSPYWGSLIEEGESAVSDDMSWALAPVAEGVEAGTSRAQTWNLSITADSRYPDASWQFIEAVTSADVSLRSALEWSNAPGRQSTFEDEAFGAEFPLAEDWLISAQVARVDPPHPRLPEIIDILAEEVTAAIDGSKDTQGALTDACARIDGVLGR